MLLPEEKPKPRVKMMMWGVMVVGVSEEEKAEGVEMSSQNASVKTRDKVIERIIVLNRLRRSAM